MMSAVCSYGNMSARLDVCADRAARKIFVEVHACGLGDAIHKVFSADEYGQALDFYDGLCATIKERHGAAQKESN